MTIKPPILFEEIIHPKDVRVPGMMFRLSVYTIVFDCAVIAFLAVYAKYSSAPLVRDLQAIVVLLVIFTGVLAICYSLFLHRTSHCEFPRKLRLSFNEASVVSPRCALRVPLEGARWYKAKSRRDATLALFFPQKDCIIIETPHGATPKGELAICTKDLKTVAALLGDLGVQERLPPSRWRMVFVITISLVIHITLYSSVGFAVSADTIGIAVGSVLFVCPLAFLNGNRVANLDRQLALRKNPVDLAALWASVFLASYLSCREWPLIGKTVVFLLFSVLTLTSRYFQLHQDWNVQESGFKDKSGARGVVGEVLKRGGHVVLR